MEAQKKIEQFLGIACYPNTERGRGSGYGYIAGSGVGDGAGSGNGFFRGSGYGYGFGYGSGYINGYGNCYSSAAGYGDAVVDDFSILHGERVYQIDDMPTLNISMLNGERVYQIDDVPTLIDSVSGNFAKGRILQSDLTTRPCYIAKVGNYFAHGDTLREAIEELKKTLP